VEFLAAARTDGPVGKLAVLVDFGGARGWRYAAGRWSDALEASSVRIAGKQVIGPQQPNIAPPQGGANPDQEARAAISLVINSLRAHGLISN